MTATDRLPGHAIAVIAVAGRFPGADSPEALFANLCAGRHGITRFAADELDPAIPEAVRKDPAYVAARGVLADIESFDAKFFAMLPREAAALDPQHRVLLELAWEALERAAHRPGDCDGRIGVFVGAPWSDYQRHNLRTRPDFVESFGDGNVAMATEPDFLATRIAYELGLRGPACAVNTACSTSLVAIAQAARSLLAGECDLALAGGASIAVPTRSGYRYEEGGMLSRDGLCRPFDADGTGTTFSDGAAMVVLRRLDDALADGDPIHAVLRGFAVNNDGGDKVSFSAPSLRGQADALTGALVHAEVDPATVGYVEAHGTATPMGDPIEFAALSRAYRGGETALGACAIGSVKSSVGHLVHAAGAAGLIVATLAVRDGVLPPLLHFRQANPRLQVQRTRFVMHREAGPWPGTAWPRRAGVSSFGVGGTNAHAILEQPPVSAPRTEAVGPQWLRLSAKSSTALSARIAQLRDFLGEVGDRITLAELAHTLEVGREPMSHRAAVRVDDLGAAAAALADGGRLRRGVANQPRHAVLQFPGHGAQRIGMAARLYEASSEARARIEAGLATARQVAGLDLRPLLLGGATEAELDDVRLAHPALLVCEYAVVGALHEAGLRADALLGCSLGEFAAGVAAGVMTLADALGAVARAAVRIAAAPPGAMCTAFCTAAEVHAAVVGDVVIAAEYAADAVTLAGSPSDLASTEAALRARGVRTLPLRADRAYHSPAMAPIAAALAAELAGVNLRAPQLPLYSAAIGGEVDATTACDPGHWASILTAPIAYAKTLAALDDLGDHWLVEAGPGVALTAAALTGAHDDDAPPVAAMPGGGCDADTWQELVAAVAHAWTHGVEHAAAPTRSGPVRRLVLPTYPFERTRHWIEPGRAPVASTSTNAPVVGSAPPQSAMPPLARLVQLLADAAGATVDPEATVHWSELGFDSLALTQLAIELRKAFGVDLTLRDLSGEVGTPAAVAARVRAAAPTVVAASAAATVALPPSAPPSAPTSSSSVVRPNPGVKIERKTSDRFRLDAQQRAYLDAFLARYAERTARSKAHAQQHRAYLADPRTVTGFHPLWKEIVYPIVTERSRGARLWDLDGNEYVDLLNGFGSVLFGHAPEFVNEAIVRQLERGVEIGPQSVLAGDVARLVCELTGHQRVAFTNTGSEAVLAALRLARTVTGRERVVAFDGSYHGIFDEALARPDGRGGVRAASPGIPSGYVGAMTVLPYADPESLAIIERLGGEVAAVLVEPIQGRNPDVQPREFLQRLRELTRRLGIALIFDEVVTGFRAHAAGVQGLYGIEADLATYGKVVAGGHPIGLVAGAARFLDALDGGAWRFGDDSVPEAGVTFFAGTFVRHPLALAAAKANLERIAAESPGLQTGLAAKTARLVEALRTTLARSGVGIRLGSAHSTFFLSAAPDEPWAPLLFAQLRYRGFHIWEQFPSFVTVAHQEADLAAFAAAFAESIDELQRHGLLGRARQGAHADVAAAPRPDARLGRRRDGSLAWFVPDPQRPGKFVECGDARVT